MRRNDGAFGYGADADGQVPAMPVDDVAPAGLVERLAVGGEDVAGFINIRVRDRPGQVFFENGLEALEERAVVEAAAGLDVEERRVGTGRILEPVAGLVAVGVEEEVVEALHDPNRFLEGVTRRIYTAISPSSLVGVGTLV